MARTSELELRSIFAAFDLNGDGVISKKEFVAGVRASTRLGALFSLSDWSSATGEDHVLNLEELFALAKESGTLDARPAFVATSEWQDVPSDAVCPAGLEYEMNLSTGANRARLGAGAFKATNKACSSRAVARGRLCDLACTILAASLLTLSFVALWR